MMMRNASESLYRTQGPLPPDAQSLYVVREADLALSAAVGKREYITLIGPRCCGKSSLVLRYLAHLRTMSAYVPIYIPLAQFRTTQAEPEWLSEVHKCMVDQTDGRLLPPAQPIIDMIDMEQSLITALQQVRGKILVIVLDQVETTPPDLKTAFYTMLRSLFTERLRNPSLRNLVFVLTGRFILTDLTKDSANSPFNIATNLYMTDAEPVGIEPLVSLLAHENRQVMPDVPSHIYSWTGGDVYLTQKLCAALAYKIPHGTISTQDVDHMIETYLLKDDLFHNAFESLQKIPLAADLIANLLDQREVVSFSRFERHLMLAWLEGAIKSGPEGNCILRSPLYETAFRLLTQIS